MGKRRLCIIDLYTCLAVAAIFFPSCDARKSGYEHGAAVHSRNSDMGGTIKQLKSLIMNRVEMDMPLDSSNTQPSPFDYTPPVPLPQNAPPFCLNPPFTPQPPSQPAGGGGGGGYAPFVPPMSSAPIVNQPPSSVPNPPIIVPSPPSGTLPGPPSINTPASGTLPGPPTTNVPSPLGFIPSPSVYLPPIVYPTPAVPPPPNVAPSTALWCVAKPSVPEPIIQEAMNYACGSGADCDQIQPSGSCFQPDTWLAHASYAFNSYWQRTKVGGGTCEFGGTAMLVTIDPSYDGCHFMYN